MKVLVTGSAGFIGFHVAKALLLRGDSVVGFDSVNDYYDTELKESRLRVIEELAKKSDGDYVFYRASLEDRKAVSDCFSGHVFDRVIHLAAQAGVRYSLENPLSYIGSNVVGFTNILEACRYHQIKHLTYASTSSVYGANTRMPFSEEHSVDHPLQLYAATKRANELLAHSYSYLFALPTTGLRFFTVYGPWGRPDMALFKFTKLILEDKKIPVFNSGRHSRDFTYIDDITEGVVRASDDVAKASPDWDSDNPVPNSSSAPYRIFNIGNNNPIGLMEYIGAIEKAVNKKAKLEFLPMQPGDVLDTYANSDSLVKAVGYKPRTGVLEGVSEFVDWYLEYYK